MKSLHHTFDIELAATYGVHEAILIHHFQHWVRHNKAMKRNFHEGRTWTYQTLDEIAAHFPYLSRSQVADILEKLCSGRGRRSAKDPTFEPVLRKGNFNKSKFDRTLWYAFENEEIFTILANAKMENSECQNPNQHLPTPIPHTKTHTYTNPPPPPSSKPEPENLSPPTKEEEEELEKRFKERPKNAPKIKSTKRWKETVLAELRKEGTKLDMNLQHEQQRLERIKKHKWEAQFFDNSTLKGFLIRSREYHVEISKEGHLTPISYDCSDGVWYYSVPWDISDFKVN